MPTPIKGSEIEMVGDDTTVFKGAGGDALRDALVQKNTITFAELSQAGVVVRPDDVSIDNQGRVIVKNKQFQASLKQRIAETDSSTSSGGGDDHHFFDTNCHCNGHGD